MSGCRPVDTLVTLVQLAPQTGDVHRRTLLVYLVAGHLAIMPHDETGPEDPGDVPRPVMCTNAPAGRRFSTCNATCVRVGQASAPANQADGQTYAATGCVSLGVKTIFDQLGTKNVSWKVYVRDMGNDPAPGAGLPLRHSRGSSGAGLVDPGGATPTDR